MLISRSYENRIVITRIDIYNIIMSKCFTNLSLPRYNDIGSLVMFDMRDDSLISSGKGSLMSFLLTFKEPDVYIINKIRWISLRTTLGFASEEE